MNSEAQPAETEVNHAFHVSRQTWTHIALHCKNIDEMIAWYEQHTHFSLLFKEEDPFGAGAWMGDKSQVEQPFVLVFQQFAEGNDPFSPAEHHPLGPFAHIGIEVPKKEDVDDIAAKAEKTGSLIMGPVRMPKRIGYICFVRDPEGNVVEFSFDQGVYTKAREAWAGE